MSESDKNLAQTILNEVRGLDTKVVLHIQKTEYELKRIHEQDTRQNTLLDKHIDGVKELKKLYKLQETACLTRFEEASAPMKWVRTTVKVSIALAAFVGVVNLVKWCVEAISG